MQIGGNRRQPGDRQRRRLGAEREKRVVPIDLHVRPNPHAPLGREPLSRHIHNYRFVLTGREREVGDRAPLACHIAHLHDRSSDVLGV